MSLFGSLMGDFDDDLFMGNHMNVMNQQMRSMNRLMNSFMPDPFNMMAPFDTGFQQNALMERGNQNAISPMGGLFGFPAMPNINRLLSADIGTPNGASYCSSSVITMSSGPDGRPQIYQATSSTKTGPGGIRETRKTVEDSRRGMKKMAIGHHIGERAHIIEKEQDLRSGQLEERQEFINLDEDEAEDFDREFTNRAHLSGVRGARPQEMITIESADDDGDDDVRPRHYSRHHHGGQNRKAFPALPAPPQQQNSATTTSADSLLTTGGNANANNTNNNELADKLSTSPSNTGKTATIASTNNNNNSNGYNSYLPSNSMRRPHQHLYRNSGITARRPLRTPPSSPLTTTPSNHRSYTTTTSVHPHPYNASAARRNHRSKHTKQHQQPHQPQTLTITEILDDDEDEEQQQQPTAVIEEESDDEVAAGESGTAPAAAEKVVNPAASKGAAAAAAAGSAKTTHSKSHKSKH